MTGKYLFSLCNRATGSRRPKSIVVRYGPFVEDQLNQIERDFKELAKDTHLENVALSYVARRGGGKCNSCGAMRNFLHTWEPCSNCGSSGICVNYDPLKQLEVTSVKFMDEDQKSGAD